MNIEKLGPIYVGGLSVEVKYDTEILQSCGIVAQWRGTRTDIRLRRDMEKQVTLQSLIHEVGHAIDGIYNEGNEMSEPQMAAFTQGWFQVLRDNPQLAEAVVALNVDDKPGKVVPCCGDDCECGHDCECA